MPVEGLNEYWLKRMACPKCGDWNRGECSPSPTPESTNQVQRDCPTCGSVSYMRTQVKAWTGKTVPFDQPGVPDFSAPVQTLRLRNRKAVANKKATGRPKDTQTAARHWGPVDKPEMVTISQPSDL